MKNVYELTSKEVKKEGKEFNKTAYGLRMFKLKTIGAFISILALIIYSVIYCSIESEGFNELVQEGFFWIILLLGSMLEFMVIGRYDTALKEYIEYKNKNK